MSNTNFNNFRDILNKLELKGILSRAESADLLSDFTFKGEILD